MWGPRRRSPADRRRVRSFAGLSIGRLGGRAYTAISETFLTLFVAGRTTSAFAVTFAVSAHRLVEWVTYPIVGAASDRQRGALGRRVPFVAGALLTMAACTWLFTVVPGYWPLVAAMVVARLASTAFGFTSFVVVPEVFGRSRWVRAAVAVGVAGAVIAISIRVVVIGTWDDDDASTWNTTFRLAAVYMVIAGLAVLALVREVPQAPVDAGAPGDEPASGAGVPAGSGTPDTPGPAEPGEPGDQDTWRDRLREFATSPEARIPWSGVLVAMFAAGAMGRLYPVFLQDELGASTSTIAALPWLTALPFLLVVVPVGVWLAGRLPRRTTAILGGWAMLVLPLGGIVARNVTEATVITLIGGIPTIASVIALAAPTLGALPARGSLGERVGTIAGPLGVSAVAGTYTAGLVAEVAGLRAMWLVPSACGLALIAIYRRLPDDDAPGGIVRVLLPLVALRRSAAGADRRLFGGDVEASDADGAVVIDRARQLAQQMMGAAGGGASPAALVALDAIAGRDHLADDAMLVEDGTPTAGGADAVRARLAAAGLSDLAWAEVDVADHPPVQSTEPVRSGIPGLAGHGHGFGAHPDDPTPLPSRAGVPRAGGVDGGVGGEGAVAVLATRPGRGFDHVRVAAALDPSGAHVVALWVDTVPAAAVRPTPPPPPLPRRHDPSGAALAEDGWDGAGEPAPPHAGGETAAGSGAAGGADAGALDEAGGSYAAEPGPPRKVGGINPAGPDPSRAAADRAGALGAPHGLGDVGGTAAERGGAGGIDAGGPRATGPDGLGGGDVGGGPDGAHGDEGLPAPVPVVLDTDRAAMRRRTRRAWRVFARHLGVPLLRRAARRPIGPGERGERLADAFGALGGTYVKFAQLLAAAPDLAGPELSAPLRRLLDAGPALPLADVERAIAADLGRPVGDLFTSIEPTPLGAGSLAVVHGAVTTDGHRVAVKVLRPGIEATVAADLEVLGELVPLLAPAEQASGLVEALRLLRRQLAEELDLRNELLTMRHARAVLPTAAAPAVTVPATDAARSGRRTLTMARVDGVPLDDADGIARLGHDPAPLLDQAVRAWFTNAVRYRSFHGDVHAGNLMLCTDGRLAVLDWGITGRLRPPAHAALRAVVAASLGDDGALAHASRALAGALVGSDDPPAVLVDVVAGQLRASFAPGADRATMGSFLREARAQQQAGGVAAWQQAAPTAAARRDSGVDHGLYLLAKQMLYFERYAAGRGDRPLLDDDAFFRALLAGDPLPPWRDG